MERNSKPPSHSALALGMEDGSQLDTHTPGTSTQGIEVTTSCDFLLACTGRCDFLNTLLSLGFYLLKCLNVLWLIRSPERSSGDMWDGEIDEAGNGCHQTPGLSFPCL